jgi:hypothetical protein
MAIQSFTLKADLDDDGVFEADWSAYLLKIGDCGLSRRAAVDAFPPAKATFELDNTDSRFSPRNTAGAYYPNLKKGKRVQLSSQVTTPAVTNKITNPSFETDTAGWAVGGTNTLVQSSVEARWGQDSGKATYQDNAILAAFSFTATAVAHALSVYLWIPTAYNGTNLRLEASNFVGATGTLAVDANMDIRDRWQRLSLSFTPAGGDLVGELKIAERGTVPTAGRFVYLDGAQAETGTSAGLYTDGDQVACAWTGTAHASTSTRTANPTFIKFTGELREMAVSRARMTGRAVFQATGISETTKGVNISCGPFSRKKGSDVLQRVLDIIEGEVSERVLGLTGEALRDGAFRFAGDTWTDVGTPTSSNQGLDTGTPAGDDPLVYDALEGDKVMEIGVDLIGDGRETNLITNLTPGKPYHISCFMQAGNAGASGKSCKLSAIGTLTSVQTATAIINTGIWTYFSLNVTLTAGETNLWVRIQSDETFTGKIWVDGVHVSPIYSGTGTPQVVKSDLPIGTKWSTQIEYFDAFHRRAGLVLDELAASVGGWYYEAGDGDLVFEDYSRRDPTDPILNIPTLRLSDAPEDGQAYRLSNFDEPPSSLARTVRVSSFGDVSALPAPAGDRAKIAWSLEPVPLALGANVLRTFFADYPADGEAGAIIARRAVPLALAVSGWAADSGVATPYVINYGRAGDLKIKAPGGGQTIYRLLVGARAQARQTTERSSIEVGSGDPVMDLEMPGQGSRTQAMTDLATWAENKYSIGPAVVEVQISGADTESLLDVLGREIGEPVWLKHKTGQAHFGIDALFFCEGLVLNARAVDVPVLTMTLEEAP